MFRVNLKLYIVQRTLLTATEYTEKVCIIGTGRMGLYLVKLGMKVRGTEGWGYK